MFADLASSQDLAWRLFLRDLSAQYRQSLLGVFWAFLPPLITSLIFIVLQSRQVINFAVTSIPYPVYVLVGTILWQIFTDSLNAPLKAITAARSFLVKINFQREALIMAAFYLVVFNVLIRMIILAAVFVFFHLQPTPALLLVPFTMLALIILGMGIGLLLTPLGALYTDVSTSLPIAVQLFFFITPVVYPIPHIFPLSLLAVLNPVTPLLTASRDLITTGSIANPTAFFVVSGLSLVLLFLAWIIYRVALPIIIERMSS